MVCIVARRLVSELNKSAPLRVGRSSRLDALMALPIGGMAIMSSHLDVALDKLAYLRIAALRTSFALDIAPLLGLREITSWKESNSQNWFGFSHGENRGSCSENEDRCTHCGERIPMSRVVKVVVGVVGSLMGSRIEAIG